ncbi:MAG TPA: response regulator [Candidatus Angelobacter sp.]|jgi:DNA-binding response OmpR family regulator|nr:response regulator [Candidatus Angelobacter sp.]
MANVLIVEDDVSDLRKATSALAEIGLGPVDPASSVGEALRYLDEAVEGKRSRPALIILDLSLGYESGFEILRRWRSDRKLSGIQIVVWTQMGEREQEICRLFGLKHVISKWADPAELQEAVKAAMQSPSSPSSAAK